MRRGLLSDEGGAAAAEYALILAIIGVAIAVGIIFLGDTISASIRHSGNTIAQTSANPGGQAGQGNQKGNNGKHNGKGPPTLPPGHGGTPPGQEDNPGKGD